MAELPIVYVDMDGVMAEFDRGLEGRLLEADPTIDLSDESSDFYLHKRLKTPEAVRMAQAIANMQGFFLGLEPADGLQEGWQRMIAAGFHPIVLSKPLSSNPWCATEKLEWLDGIMGPKVTDEAIIAGSKADFDGAALIDDRPETPGADRATWQQAMFSRPYNLNVATGFRIDSWHDPNLESVLARCALRYSSLFEQPLL